MTQEQIWLLMERGDQRRKEALESSMADEGPDLHGVQCCECDEESVGFDRDGSPYCAVHFNRFRRVSGEDFL